MVDSLLPYNCSFYKDHYGFYLRFGSKIIAQKKDERGLHWDKHQSHQHRNRRSHVLFVMSQSKATQ